MDEIANVPPRTSAAYVGRSAFAHKAGLHVDAMRKNPETYEHLDPELVGNERRILVSELSGASTILEKVQKDNLDLRQRQPGDQGHPEAGRRAGARRLLVRGRRGVV